MRNIPKSGLEALPWNWYRTQHGFAPLYDRTAESDPRGVRPALGATQGVESRTRRGNEQAGASKKRTRRDRAGRTSDCRCGAAAESRTDDQAGGDEGAGKREARNDRPANFSGDQRAIL